MSATGLLAAVLAVLLLGALAAVVALTRQLRAARSQVAELEELVRRVRVEETRNPRAVQAAGLAVRTAVDAVTRVRERGFRGMLMGSIDDLTSWALEDHTEIVRVADENGDVTIMFSDIEGSTSLNSELGDERWVRLLRAHDRLLHTWIDKHRGHVVKSQGDGYMVVFSTPELALRAALDIQRALRAGRRRQLRRTPIRVRIGLHTGHAIERDGDWFGRNVAMAARVAALADGGEILVSQDVADALAGHADFSFVEEDVVELKGLPGEHRLWLAEAA